MGKYRWLLLGLEKYTPLFECGIYTQNNLVISATKSSMLITFMVDVLSKELSAQ